MQRGPLAQFLAIPFFVSAQDIGEGKIVRFHEWERHCPFVYRRAKTNTSFLNAEMPFIFEFLWHKTADINIDFFNDLEKFILHSLWCELKLPYQTIHFIDEKNRFHSLLQRLPKHGLCLWHHPLYSIHKYNSAICCPHCPRHFSTKINMSRSINQIDQVPLASNLVDHIHACRIYRNPSFFLISMKISYKKLSRELFRDHSGSRKERVSHCSLAMVDVRDYADIPDVLWLLHQAHNFFYLIICHLYFRSAHSRKAIFERTDRVRRAGTSAFRAKPPRIKKG